MDILSIILIEINKVSENYKLIKLNAFLWLLSEGEGLLSFLMMKYKRYRMVLSML
jgi:hypothetical protein